MESIFTFHQVNCAGRLGSTFLAEVCWMEEGVFQQSARPTPYLRVMLTQDDGETIMVAIATGNFYHVAKNLYQVGNVYCFPGGMFDIRPRTAQDSCSSYPFDLWFLNDSATSDQTSPKSCRTSELEDSMQNMSIF
ncbi:ABC transporter B family member 12 [Folsomia candida]|uniref:ABC transporter B family member 12 n=1 Tax=Folsomia candida TaxID=158441 RepID=A0A226DKY0_FOLCA|nr:ABC transporter B family member 12 [Folsomia candida]